MAREIITTSKCRVAGIRQTANGAEITFATIARNALGARAVSQTVVVEKPDLVKRLEGIRIGDEIQATIAGVFGENGTWSYLVDFETQNG